MGTEDARTLSLGTQHHGLALGSDGESRLKEGMRRAVSWEHGQFRLSVAPPAVAGH